MIARTEDKTRKIEFIPRIQPVQRAAPKTVDSQDLFAELDESLQRGLRIAWDVALADLLRDSPNAEAVKTTLENLMRERARNLAAAYADRMLDEGEL
jgi:hypothetical protein